MDGTYPSLQAIKNYQAQAHAIPAGFGLMFGAGTLSGLLGIGSGAVKVLAISLGTIQFGLLLLVATPIARVVFSAVAFAIQRDFMYVGITLVVLFVLMFSILGGTL